MAFALVSVKRITRSIANSPQKDIASCHPSCYYQSEGSLEQSRGLVSLTVILILDMACQVIYADPQSEFSFRRSVDIGREPVQVFRVKASSSIWK